MKKLILVILLWVILIPTLTGCSKLQNKFEIGAKSDITLLSNDVLMNIKEKSLSNTGATLILQNNADKLLYYDEIYQMEINQNNEWHKINVDLMFNDPLWQVPGHQLTEITLNWQHGYGKLAKGQYRIIKEVYFKNKDEKEPSFYVAAEFTIE